jgi:hypothetical protein
VIKNAVEIGDCSSVRQAAGYGCKVRILAQSATTPLFAESITISCPTIESIQQFSNLTLRRTLGRFVHILPVGQPDLQQLLRSDRGEELKPHMSDDSLTDSRVRVFRLRQGNTIMLAKGNPLIDHLPQMPKDFFRIVAMNPAAHEFRALTNIALVFVGPIHQVLVSIAFSHSDNFFRSSFSWYGLASSPSCPEIVSLFFPSGLVKLPLFATIHPARFLQVPDLFANLTWLI